MTIATAAESTELTHVNSFIRYSGRDAEGGYIRANGDYSFTMEDHPTIVRNARLEQIDFATHGFTLVRHRTEAAFDDPADVERRYYPEACRIVRELTGASEVFAFLGIRRGGETNAGGGPALSAHVDFNEAALRGWVARLAPDRAESLLRKRLVNINLWRPLRTVQNYPLAVCDARSVERSDFMNVRFGEGGQTSSLAETAGGLNLAFNPKHRWYYYPDMQPDEILVFRLFDTGDSDWHMTAHTAFEDPTSPPGASPRESFELRTVAIFD